MNKNIITIIVLFIIGLNTIDSYAAPVGSAFSYQGELTDGGVPANGLYDVFLGLHPQDTGSVINALEFFDIQVTNGLFIIPEVDFGNQDYNGDDLWLSVAFREAASIIGVTSYTTLSPRQRINAVPYAVQAEFLAPNGANNGDVLQFNGTDWVANAVNVNSPWTDNGANGLGYLGKVGVGINEVTNGFQFQIKQSNANIEPFEVTNSTGIGMFRIRNDGKVGIRSVFPEARLHVNSKALEIPLRIDVNFQRKFTIDADGRTIIGDDPILPNFNANAKLGINEVDGEHPLSVKRNGLLELLVEKNGGVSIGTNFAGGFPPMLAPDRGLYVAGDFKTDPNSNGMIKYMVSAYCGGTITSNIQKSYSTITNGNGVTISPGLTTGRCEITFPTTVNDRYVMAFARNNGAGARTVNCGFISVDTLHCVRSYYDNTQNSHESGNIDIFIF